MHALNIYSKFGKGLYLTPGTVTLNYAARVGFTIPNSGVFSTKPFSPQERIRILFSAIYLQSVKSRVGYG